MNKSLLRGALCALLFLALRGALAADADVDTGQDERAEESHELAGLSLKIDKKNYSWSGKVLTVKFAHGARDFNNSPVEDINSVKYHFHHYLGYDAGTGFHFVETQGWEWRSLELIDGESGAVVSLGQLLPNGISPDRQWVLNLRGEMGDCSGAIQMTRIPKKGESGKQKNVVLPKKLGECRDPDSTPRNVQWLSETRAQVSWECRDENGETRPDRITLEWRGNAWDVDRVPCGKAALAPAQQAPRPVAPAQAGAQSLGVTGFPPSRERRGCAVST